MHKPSHSFTRRPVCTLLFCGYITWKPADILSPSQLSLDNYNPNNREFKVPNMPTTRVCDGIMTTRTTNILGQTTRAADMDFSGTWQVYSEENLEDFLKVVGAPEMVVKMRKEVKPQIVIEQNGKDFTLTIKTPICTQVHSFTIGKESEMVAVDGRKFKCTMREEGGKLIAETGKFTSVRELRGDEMVETITAGSVTFICKSKRV